MKFFFILFFSFCCCFCNKAFIAMSKQVIDQNQVQEDSSVIRLTSQKTLSGILSKEYYLVKAYFQEDNSKLELFSHFSGFELEDGVKVHFVRKEMGLVIKASVQGFPDKTLFKKEDYFSNSNEVDFSVEVDNGTNYGFRVRVWENFTNKSGILKNKTGVLTDENLIADSLSDNLTFYTKGQGIRWGLKLFRVRLTEGARIPLKIL